MELKPFDPQSVLLISLLNPVVIGVAIWMGRMADQWQKLIIAGFAASLAGVVVAWFATYLGFLPASGFGTTGGLLIAQFFLGMLWAALAYYFIPRPR